MWKICLLFFIPCCVCAQVQIWVQKGVLSNGLPSADWVLAIGKRHTWNDLLKIQKHPQVFSHDQRVWLTQLYQMIDPWKKQAGKVSVHFPNKGPLKIRLLVGNQGGTDAFIFMDDTIVFDLEQLNKNYGKAGRAENTSRLIRLLNHEYSQLMLKDLRRSLPRARNEYERVLQELHYEGIGDYFSLSKKWKSLTGLSSLGEKMLRKQAFILNKKLAQLREQPALGQNKLWRKGMASGELEANWGSLPIALLIHKKQSQDIYFLNRLITDPIKGIQGLLQETSI